MGGCRLSLAALTRPHPLIFQKRHFLIRAAIASLRSVALACPETTWPRHLFNPAIYRDEVERRFRRITEFEGRSGILSTAVALIFAHLGEGKVGDLVVNAMNKALTDAGLN